MARPEKVAQVELIAEKLGGLQSLVLADFTGLSVEQMTIFRAQCRSRGVECRVVKNRLAKIAADQAELQFLKDHLTGPTAMISSPESQVEPAKIVIDFAQENEAMQVKGGIVEGKFLTPPEVVALSKVPSRDELIAKMMGSLQSPLTGLVYTLNGVTGALTRAIDAVAKQKAEAA
jgi:large subunit ribosomal protein L10